jgi:hypothetical protein
MEKCDNIRLHGGWLAPCEMPRTLLQLQCLVVGLWSHLLKKKKKRKTIFTMTGEPLMAQKKTSSENAHLQGHQKLHHPPNSATCKYYLENTLRNFEGPNPKGFKFTMLSLVLSWVHPI